MSGRRGGNSALDIRRVRRWREPQAKPERESRWRDRGSLASAGDLDTVYFGLCPRCQSRQMVSREMKFGLPTYTFTIWHESTCPNRTQLQGELT